MSGHAKEERKRWGKGSLAGGGAVILDGVGWMEFVGWFGFASVRGGDGGVNQMYPGRGAERAEPVASAGGAACA